MQLKNTTIKTIGMGKGLLEMRNSRHLRIHRVRWIICLDVEAAKVDENNGTVEDREIDANLVCE